MSCIARLKDVGHMRVVLRIGGSVIASPINQDLICKYADVLRQLNARKHDLAVVVGGGSLARQLIAVAKGIGLAESDQDEVAISVSRVFALLFLRTMGAASCASVPLTLQDVVKCLSEKKIVIMGGLKPGMTTDTVAALVAEEVNADLLVKATDQEGVYDRDPTKSPDAVMIKHLHFKDLSSVLLESKHKAGIHQILDPEAVKILSNHKMKVVVVNGYKPKNVLSAVDGKRVGTLID